ncbi:MULTISPECIES: hypothetical protein [unclassified Curtobacterium]|uniref:hypothetical protein n=1 Tax=unclassified Curtobacterium TaxID=257496 RepID=UPI0039B11A19
MNDETVNVDRWLRRAAGWCKERAPIISTASLVLGIVTLVFAVVAVGLWGRPVLGYTSMGIMGACEFIWLASSEASPTSGKTARAPWRFRWHALCCLLVGVAGAALVVLPPDAKSNGPEPLVEVLGRGVVVLLFASSVAFLAVIVTAVSRSETTLLTNPFPKKTQASFRLELWYGYVGASFGGIAIGVLIRDHAGLWGYVILFWMLVVISACIAIVLNWHLFDEKLRGDAGKLLVRQSALTCLLCLALLVQSIDTSAPAVPLAVASASGVMLVPTLVELLVAILRAARTRASEGSQTT